MYVCIYIYICKEREREREIYIHIYIRVHSYHSTVMQGAPPAAGCLPPLAKPRRRHAA